MTPKRYFVLIAGGLAMFLLCKLLVWKWFYLEGRSWSPGGAILLSFIGGIACAFSLHYWVLRDHLLNYETYSTSSPYKRTKWTVIIVYDFILVVLLYVRLPQTETGAVEFLHGFRDLVKNSGDTHAIIEWGREVSADPSFEKFDKRPRFIREYVEPESMDRNPDGSVLVLWGGGFMHWGLILTDPKTEPPRSNEDGNVEKIAEGIYAAVSK